MEVDMIPSCKKNCGPVQRFSFPYPQMPIPLWVQCHPCSSGPLLKLNIYSDNSLATIVSGPVETPHIPRSKSLVQFLLHKLRHTIR
jgi:hypothetical protein